MPSILGESSPRRRPAIFLGSLAAPTVRLPAVPADVSKDVAAMTQTSGDTERQRSTPRDGRALSHGHDAAYVEADGVLEMVNWRTGEFLVRDDVGHVFRLTGVANVETACRYIGMRVQAQGTARRAEDDSLRFEPNGTIELVDLPESWFAAGIQDVDALVRTAPGPDLDGAIDLSDDELTSFLAAVHG